MEICADQDASELVDAIINSLRAWKNVQIDDRYLQFVEVEDADDDYVFLNRRSVGGRLSACAANRLLSRRIGAGQNANQKASR